jgi:DNA polymerase-3 subunit epsilon
MKGFAVVDVETTGWNADGNDRVVEVAVVHVSLDGHLEGQWDTLTNPGRDLGPQRVHGISAREIRSAPLFRDIAGQLADLLRGRAFVAHNAQFDASFLAAEYRRMGLSIPIPGDSTLCTMRLGGRLLSTHSRSLMGCCQAMGIDLSQHHRASADAVASASLLAGYLRLRPDDPCWNAAMSAAARQPWPTIEPFAATWYPREAAGVPAPHFLSRLVAQLADDGIPDADDNADREYLSLLDRALLDRDISASESDALVNAATLLAIDQRHAAELHERYLAALVAAAWDDTVVTDSELADLKAVAELLAIPIARLDRLIKDYAPGSKTPPTHAAFDAFHLDPGDLVVFTGEMTRDRSCWERDATAAGLVPWASVTKNVKLVVAADPDSLSGKARKARAYGIPIVSEAAFEDLLKHHVRPSSDRQRDGLTRGLGDNRTIEVVG